MGLLVLVTLLKRHEDKGVEYPAGEIIEVDEGTAAWLREHEVIAPDSAPDAAVKDE